MARTVDHIPGGRAILGIGSGWFERDYREYAYGCGTKMSRTRDFEASLAVIRERFGKLNPPPVRGTVPILIGGGGEKVMLRIVAEHADIWNWFGVPDDFRRRNAVLDEWCTSVGRDPAAIERSANIRSHQVANATAYREAGVTHLIVGLGGPRLDLSPPAALVPWREDQ